MSILPLVLLVLHSPGPYGPVGPPIIDPYAVSSPSGVFTVHVDPSDRNGQGPATYRFQPGDGGAEVEVTHDFTLHRARVTDDGVTVGVGADGGGLDEEAHFVIAALGRDGAVLWSIEQPFTWPIYTGSTRRYPRVLDFTVQPERDRLILLQIEGVKSHGGTNLQHRMRVYRLSDGRPLGHYGLGLRTDGPIQFFGSLGQSGLVLTQTGHVQREGRRKVHSTVFRLIDEQGRQVWSSVWEGDGTVSMPLQDSIEGRRLLHAKILQTDDEGFEAWRLADNARIRFGITRSSRGAWSVTESWAGRVEPPSVGKDASQPSPSKLVRLARHSLKGAENHNKPAQLLQWSRLPDGRHMAVAWSPEVDRVGEKKGAERWQLLVYGIDGEVERSTTINGDVAGDETFEHHAWRWYHDADLGFCLMGKRSRYFRLDVANGRLEVADLPRVEARRRARELRSDMQVRTLDGRVVTVNTSGELELHDRRGVPEGSMDTGALTGVEANYVSSIRRATNGDLLIHDLDGSPSIVIVRARAVGAEGAPFELVRAFSPRWDDGLQSTELAYATRLTAEGKAWAYHLGQFLYFDSQGRIVRRVGPKPDRTRLYEIGAFAALPRGVAIQDGATGCVHLWSHDGEPVSYFEGESYDMENADMASRVLEDPLGGVWIEADEKVATWEADGSRGVTLPVDGDDVRPSRSGTWRWGYEGPPTLWKNGAPVLTLERSADRRWIREVLDLTEHSDGSVFVLQDRTHGDGSHSTRYELVEYSPQPGGYRVQSAMVLPQGGWISAEGDWVLVGRQLLRRSSGEWFSVENAYDGRRLSSTLASGAPELILFDESDLSVERWRLPD